MPYIITDKFLKNLLRSRSIVRINGEKYYATTATDFALGDVVLDRLDGTYGVIDMIIGDKAALASEGATEVGVPFSRLVKLRKFNAGNVN